MPTIDIMTSLSEEAMKFSSYIANALKEYFEHGSRSSKKVDVLHKHIKEEIDACIQQVDKASTYSCVLEYNVSSVNASGKKRSDIVVLKNGIPHIVFPVKFIMTNYKQNKNNSWENLTGELSHLKWANPDLYIIPINVIFNQVPYLKSGGIISKFETISYKNSFQIYEMLMQHKIAHKCLNYIIDVKQQCLVGEKYDKTPELGSYNADTPHIPFGDLLAGILD